MNTNFYNSVTNFIKKRTLEFAGLSLILLSILLFISLLTYSPDDPSFVYGEQNVTIKNFFGIYGSSVSDFLLQCFGMASFLILGTLISWGFTLIFKKELRNIIFKLFYLTLSLSFGCVFIYMTFNNSFWLIDNGNSGFIGQILYDNTYKHAQFIDSKYYNFLLIFLTFLFFSLASGIKTKPAIKSLLNILFNLFKFKKKNTSTVLTDNFNETNDQIYS